MDIKIGDTVIVDGKEFVIYSFNFICDLEGRALTMHGMDAQRAMRHMEEQENRRKSLEAQTEIGKLIPQMKKQLED